MQQGLEAQGATPIATPNLDRLAAGGMMFTDAHSPCSLCPPTRFAMMAGPLPFRYGKRLGSWNFSETAAVLRNRKHTTVGEVMQAAGYRTAMLGKMHIAGGDTLNFTQPERPIPTFPTSDGFDYTFVEHDGIQDPPIDFEPDAVGNPGSPPNVPVQGVNASWGGNAHSDMVYELDLRVGRILAKLEDPDGNPLTDDSILANTLILLTSDNGGLMESMVPAGYDSTGILRLFKSHSYGDGTVPQAMLELRDELHALFLKHDDVSALRTTTAYDVDGFVVPPTALGPDEVTMTSVTGVAAVEPIEYRFSEPNQPLSQLLRTHTTP